MAAAVPVPARRRRDGGFTPVAAALIFAMFALMGGIVLTGQLTLATSAKGQAQHGADAAALAGAQKVLDLIPDDVRPGFLTPEDIPLLLGGRCSQTGRAEATRLADANGDTLTTYCYDAFRDEVTVDVVNGDGTAQASATAATTFDAGGCTLSPDFVPPQPGDPAPKPGDPPSRTTIDCGLTALTITFDPVDSRFHFVGLEAVLAAVQPRLTR